MTHIGLFEGIGGFSLAARWMGWHTLAWCEWNPFGQQILRHHFPEAIGHDDITKTDFTPYANRVDILTGGFPCQPYSVAGKRKGKDDERHLWPEMLRAIREIQPRWVVGENVSGLVNWNGGMVFDEVQAELEAAGYEVIPFILPAAGVNAPHRRDRVWFVAYGHGLRRPQEHELQQSEIHKQYGKGRPTPHAAVERLAQRQQSGWGCTQEEGGTGVDNRTADNGNNGPTPHPDSERQQERITAAEPRTQVGQYCETHIGQQPADWHNFPTQPPVCGRNDGFPTESLRQRIREDSMGLIHEKEIDKIISKANTEWRNESIKAYGNAIVPQVALQIFKAIQQFEESI